MYIYIFNICIYIHVYIKIPCIFTYLETPMLLSSSLLKKKGNVALPSFDITHSSPYGDGSSYLVPPNMVHIKSSLGFMDENLA